MQEFAIVFHHGRMLTALVLPEDHGDWAKAARRIFDLEGERHGIDYVLLPMLDQPLVIEQRIRVQFFKAL